MRKYIEHSLYALAIQLAFMLLPNTDAFVGFIAATFFFAGRELAQAEYRYIRLYSKGKRTQDMRWYKTLFSPEIWNVSSLAWDLIVPVILTGAVATFLSI
jgi:hypothetical protein